MKPICKIIFLGIFFSIQLIVVNLNAEVVPIINYMLLDKGKDFGVFGNYTPERYPNEGLQDNYVVYYPKNGINPDMPVVLFLEGGGEEPQIDDYRGVMEFMASKGYFVIGAESGQGYDSNYAKNIFEIAINTAIGKHNLNVSKLAVMGHSQGGGQAFFVMKYFRNKDYGNKGSLVLSLDGWFAFNMNQSDLEQLNTKVSFLQMNGIHGTGTDPRVHLSIWNLVDMSEKTFFIFPQNEHYYVAGDTQNVSTKKDLLLLIGALTDDAFTGSSQGYNAIAAENKTSYQDVYNALKAKNSYRADCAGVAYNAQSQLDDFTIDYCVPEAY